MSSVYKIQVTHRFAVLVGAFWVLVSCEPIPEGKGTSDSKSDLAINSTLSETLRISDQERKTPVPKSQSSPDLALNLNTSQKTIAYLIENQGLLNPNNVQDVALWSARLDIVSIDDLIDGINRIKDEELLPLIFSKLLARIPWRNDGSALFEAGRKIMDLRGRRDFLAGYLGQHLNEHLPETLNILSSLRDLKPPHASLGWYNQLVADTIQKNNSN